MALGSMLKGAFVGLTQAKTREERAFFLDMAWDWTLAAMRLEGVLVTDGAPTKPPPERHP